MAQQNKPVIKGFAKLTIAPITVENNGTYTYGALQRINGVRSFSAEPQGEKYTLYADSQIYYTEETNNGYTATVEVVKIADTFKKILLGLSEDTTNKMLIEYSRQQNEPPKFGMTAEFLSNEKSTIYVFYDCQVTKRPSLSAQTSEASINPQFETIEIQIAPRPYDNLVLAYTTQDTPETVYKQLETGIWQPTTIFSEPITELGDIYGKNNQNK